MAPKLSEKSAKFQARWQGSFGQVSSRLNDAHHGPTWASLWFDLLIDDGLFTDVPASNSPDDALPRWFTGDCAAARPARDIFALILAEAADSCDPDSRTGKPSSEVALACHLVKSRQTRRSLSLLDPAADTVSLRPPLLSSMLLEDLKTNDVSFFLRYVCFWVEGACELLNYSVRTFFLCLSVFSR